MNNKNYLVTYNGLWLFGKAVVRAKSKEEAIELVRDHHSTVYFKNVEVEELPKTGVLYNDNGDY